MRHDRQMRTLIYKRVHTGDPDPKTGVFGNNDCMGSARGRRLNAVIGVGGLGREPKSYGIAGKLNWIGIDPIYSGRTRRGPRLRFRHFMDFEQGGPLMREKYPALASYMYDNKVRSFVHPTSPAGGREVNEVLNREVRKILRLAAMPRSKHLAKQTSRDTGGKCPKPCGVC
jgi:hypothetical protein